MEETISNQIKLQMITLRVKDLDKCLGFYHDILGFDILQEENDTAYLGMKETQRCLLALVSEPDGKEIPAAGIAYFTFILPTEIDIEALYAHLKYHQYPVKKFVSKDQKVILRLNDPAGNNLVFYSEEAETESGSIYDYPDENEQVIKDIPIYNHIPRTTKLGTLALKVSNLEKSKSFYMELGLKIKEKYANKIRLATSITKHTLWLKQEKVKALKEEYLGLDYLQFTISSMEELLVIKDYLQERGKEFFFNRGKAILHIEDPDGLYLWISLENQKLF